MTITVFVEQHPNEDMRTIHLSKPITLRPFTKYGTSGLPKKAMRLNNAFNLRPELLAGGINDFVNHKDIRIERNKAYTWEQAVSAAVSVLERFYGQKIEVVHGERKPEWDRPRRDEEWSY